MSIGASTRWVLARRLVIVAWYLSEARRAHAEGSAPTLDDQARGARHRGGPDGQRHKTKLIPRSTDPATDRIRQ